MTERLVIRQVAPADLAGIEAIYPLAFPDEDLLPVVRSLLAEPNIAMSMVGEIDGSVVGNIIFTDCGVNEATTGAALLAPLAVMPSHHGQRIGSALIRAGLESLREQGLGSVFVLGDPAFYGRLGFKTETRVEPPYPLPAAWASAWQSQELCDTTSLPKGKLWVPDPWRDPALWSE